MTILVRHNGKFYRIGDEVLTKSEIAKADFEARLRKLETQAAEQAKALRSYQVMDFSDDDFAEIVRK